MLRGRRTLALKYPRKSETGVAVAPQREMMSLKKFIIIKKSFQSQSTFQTRVNFTNKPRSKHLSDLQDISDLACPAGCKKSYWQYLIPQRPHTHKVAAVTRRCSIRKFLTATM